MSKELLQSACACCASFLHGKLISRGHELWLDQLLVCCRICRASRCRLHPHPGELCLELIPHPGQTG